MTDFECYRIKRAAYLDAAAKRGRLSDNYQDEETKADPKHGRKLIKQLRDEFSIEDRIAADAPEYEDVFEDILSDDRGGYILYWDYLDKLSEMVEIAERETAERRASLELIMEKIFERFYRPDVDLDERRSVTGAFLEYNYSVELICRKLSYIRTACMYYGVFLVKAIPVDRIIAEHIKEHLNTEAEVFDDKMPLSQIPGFIVSWDSAPIYQDIDMADQEMRWTDYDSIMAGIEEISEYMLKHPQQVDAQCLMSVVTGTEGLAEVSCKAGALDAAIDRYSVTDEGRSLDAPNWRRLFNGWVMVKAFYRVTRLVLEFVNDYKDETVGVATDALEKLLPSMSYALVQRNVRISLRQTILEGGIYEFKLSEVVIPEPVKKIARSLRCLKFKDTPGAVLTALLKMIVSDKRLLSLPGTAELSESLKGMGFICAAEKKILGAIFIAEQGDTLVLENLYNVENKAAASLVCAAYEAAMNEFGQDKTVIVPVINDRSAGLIESFVPGAKRERLIKAQKQ